MEDAIEIIERSILMHPTLFVECLQNRAVDDLLYIASRPDMSKRVRDSVMASVNAALHAADLVEYGQARRFRDDMAAGIIALNIACRLQYLPPHIRTDAAVKTWET